MFDAFVGIDIAKAKFDVTVLEPGNNPQHRSFENAPEGFTALSEWLRIELIVDSPHFCMEATGRYGEALAYFLYDTNQCVSVVNPSCIKNYGRSKLRRTKTDKVDSALIAEFCQKECPALWTPLPKESRELQQLTRELEHVKRLLAHEKNRSKAGVHAGPIKDAIESLMNFLEGQIQVLEGEIRLLIDSHKKLKKQKKLLLTIPGIGETTAHSPRLRPSILRAIASPYLS